MCNGPSLKDVDFKTLNDYDTFGMNLAFRYYFNNNWYPTYFGSFDVLYNRQFKEDFRRLIRKSRGKIKDFFFIRKVLQRPHVHTVPTNGELYTFSEDIDNFGNGGNTGVNCCQVGICLGYKKIILLGADCNFVEVVDGSSEGDGERLVVGDQCRDNPNYFCDYYQQSGDVYNKPNVDKYHRPAWESLSSFAKNIGVDIVNCSSSSTLTCFRKSELYSELELRGDL